MMKNTCYYLIRTFRCLIKFRNTLRTWQTACISMFLEHKTLSVDRQLVSAIRMQIEKNREKMLSILKTVFFCGRHNIHLRGHRDDSKHMLEDSRSTEKF